MYGSVVTVLNMGKTLIPCMRILGIVHAQNMHNNPIDNLGLAIHFRVEGCGFDELGVHP
jgi:hypothetical protein